MQTHAGSRSRPWSRSHSPSHSREKKYPRGYHNGREFRGYHRGFRRPYNFRGRGRGFFPRGRYQRGGYNNNNNNNGNNGNHNFRPNWKNYKQYPEKPQQQQNQPRGRPHNAQGRSETPPRGPANHSDRSPSPLSRHSQHSSSSSHSSSPKWKPTLLLTNGKEETEALCAPGEVPKGAGGDGDGGGGGGGGEEPAELAGPAGDAKEGNCTGSPKGASPGASCAAAVGPNSQTTRQSSPSPKITNDIGNGAPSWKMACSSSPSTKKKLHEGLNPMLSSYDFFSNEEFLDGDKTAISVAFREFLEEQKKKKAFENGKNTEANDVDMEQGRMRGKPSTIISDSRRFREDTDGEVSLRSFLKASPFLSADGEEDGEAVIKPHPKPPHRDWHSGDESFKAKIKVPQSAGEVFDERPGKWQNVTFSRVVDPADHAHLTRKQGKAAAALARREMAGKCERLSPDVGGKARKTAKSPSILSSTPPPRRSSDRELWGEDSHFTPSRKQEIKLNVRMDLLGDSLMRSSDILAEERQLSQDLVQSSKKDQEFRSIFQHVQAAPLQKSPSELFAQHIVTIVHHVKAQHFPSSGMTFNERFTVYQRRAAEKEMAKPRKSPEIHRRIDVSPRAFQKHSQLFEAMKNSEDGTYKDGGEKITGDPMDLRLDIERRKKCSVHDRDSNQDLGGDVGDSPDSSRDGSSEKLSKTSERSKKSQKKRPRSSSSSSSSSSKSQREDSSDPKGQGCDRAQPGQTEPTGPAERGRPPAGFQVRIRGRSWNGGSYQGNSSQRNAMTGAAPQPTDEDWDADHTERRRKYFLHDVRERGAEGKAAAAAAADSRGRGSLPRGRARFIVRSAGGGGATPKWADDKFRVNGERGDARQATQRDHEDGGDT